MDFCPSQDIPSDKIHLSHVGRSGTHERMTHTLDLTLGEALRLMRERAHLIQSQLGAELELGRTSVIRYEADASVPKWRDVEAWAIACDHDPELVRDLWEQAVAAVRTGRYQGVLFAPDDPTWAGRAPLQRDHRSGQFALDDAA